MMKINTRQIVTSSILFSTVVALPVMAQSAESSKLQSYIGINAQERHMSYKRGFGDNLYPRTAPQGNVYAGLKVLDYLGFEAGYEMTESRKKNTTLTTGDLIEGVALSSTMSPSVFKSKVKMRGPHFDVVGFYQIGSTPWQLMGSVGVAGLKGYYERKTISYAGIADGMTRTISKSKVIARLGVGVQYMFNHRIGGRISVGWANTSRIIAKDERNSMSAYTVKPKDTANVGVGLLVAF